MARELLKNGAKVNVTGMDGVTPLHDASVNGHENMVALLLRYGANPHLKTSSNKTAMDLATSSKVIQLLSKHSSVSEDNSTDENSPEPLSRNDGSWVVKFPKSRRSLQLGRFDLF